MQILGADELENNFVSKLEWIKTERMDELGSVMFQCRRKNNYDYGKSSSFVFVENMKCYGQISHIFEHYEKEIEHTWIEVSLFPNHSLDMETCLPYVNLFEERRNCIVRTKDLSEPLIVAIEEPNIWFISLNHNSHFQWLNEHLL